MDITPLIPRSASIIQAYTAGGFRISGHAYHTPVIVQPNTVVPWAGFDDMDRILAMKDDVDVVLVGCGSVVTDAAFAMRKRLKEGGIHAEFMDTGAACRTFNVLLTEGRRVAAALVTI